ncbi:dienelactone hydrolase family protein [Armatimonas sp.]|uniref:dienelactone hydrolase family protein n=1 Tax=Armatimonas sp. TaxID=1872638 RepID=UPI00286AA0A7|nr:dienelactone hydrolase family protein [Armatimonas sp.]
MKHQTTNPIAARYETGQRLRRFETLWETASAEKKRQVLPLVNQAVMGFFAGGPSASAKPLDAAIGVLFNGSESVRPHPWGMPLVATPSARLLDSAAGRVTLTITQLYTIPEKAPSATEFFVSGKPGTTLYTASTSAVAQQFKAFPQEIVFPLPNLEDDVTLFVEVDAGADQGQNIADRLVNLALAKNLKPRLAALENSVEPSVVHLLGILKKLAAGEPLETDFPGLKLLLDAEAAAKNAPLWGKKTAGQFWLMLNKAPVRLLAPKAVESGKPLPLVIALHGSGGSENMFFDTYGAGKIMRLCEERGWLLLTLRNGAGLSALPEMLAELGKLYSYDTKRVFLTGHSMGAAMAVQAAQANPKVFAAVAVLGGGGAVRNAPDTLPPFLVGAGASDFGKPMAQSLAKALKTECKIYPDCEHLTVVQDALDDVIRFFEQPNRR